MTNLIIDIEYCINCYHHNWCSRHDQKKYLKQFQEIKTKILEQCQGVVVYGNRVPQHYKKIIETNNNKYLREYSQAKYYDEQMQCVKIYPKMGSFEITVNGVLIWSKIKSSQWPNSKKIIQIIKLMIEDINNKNVKNLQKYKYQDPNINKQVDKVKRKQNNSLQLALDKVYRVRRQNICRKNGINTQRKDIIDYITKNKLQINNKKKIKKQQSFNNQLQIQINQKNKQKSTNGPIRKRHHKNYNNIYLDLLLPDFIKKQGCKKLNKRNKSIVNTYLEQYQSKPNSSYSSRSHRTKINKSKDINKSYQLQNNFKIHNQISYQYNYRLKQFNQRMGIHFQGNPQEQNIKKCQEIVFDDDKNKIDQQFFKININIQIQKTVQQQQFQKSQTQKLDNNYKEEINYNQQQQIIQKDNQPQQEIKLLQKEQLIIKNSIENQEKSQKQSKDQKIENKIQQSQKSELDNKYINKQSNQIKIEQLNLRQQNFDKNQQNINQQLEISKQLPTTNKNLCISQYINQQKQIINQSNQFNLQKDIKNNGKDNNKIQQLKLKHTESHNSDHQNMQINQQQQINNHSKQNYKIKEDYNQKQEHQLEKKNQDKQIQDNEIVPKNQLSYNQEKLENQRQQNQDINQKQQIYEERQSQQKENNINNNKQLSQQLENFQQQSLKKQISIQILIKKQQINEIKQQNIVQKQIIKQQPKISIETYQLPNNLQQVHQLLPKQSLIIVKIHHSQRQDEQIVENIIDKNKENNQSSYLEIPLNSSIINVEDKVQDQEIGLHHSEDEKNITNKVQVRLVESIYQNSQEIVYTQIQMKNSQQVIQKQNQIQKNQSYNNKGQQ